MRTYDDNFIDPADIAIILAKRALKKEKPMEPIFEVIDKNEDKHYKIYENGKVEGFGESVIVFNRILLRMATIRAKEMVRYNKLKSITERAFKNCDRVIALTKRVAQML